MKFDIWFFGSEIDSMDWDTRKSPLAAIRAFIRRQGKYPTNVEIKGSKADMEQLADWCNRNQATLNAEWCKQNTYTIFSLPTAFEARPEHNFDDVPDLTDHIVEPFTYG